MITDGVDAERQRKEQRRIERGEDDDAEGERKEQDDPLKTHASGRVERSKGGASGRTSCRVRRAGAGARGSPVVGAVLERQRAAVRFGDLPAQHQADARAPGFVVKNGTNRFAGVRQPGPFVVDPELERRGPSRAASRRATPPPVSSAASTALRTQVDQQLLELIAVGAGSSRRGPPSTRDAAAASRASTTRSHAASPTSSGASLRRAAACASRA